MPRRAPPEYPHVLDSFCFIVLTPQPIYHVQFDSGMVQGYKKSDFIDVAVLRGSIVEDQVRRWMHETRNVYEWMDFLPPPAQVPPQVLNLYKPLFYDTSYAEKFRRQLICQREEHGQWDLSSAMRQCDIDDGIVATANEFIEKFVILVQNLVTGGPDEQEKKDTFAIWMLQWVSDMLVNPGVKPGVFVIIKGVPGCGKKCFIDTLTYMLNESDQKAKEVQDIDQLIRRFSDVQKQSLLVYKQEMDQLDTSASSVKTSSIIDNLKSRVDTHKACFDEKFKDLKRMNTTERYLFTCNSAVQLPSKHIDRKVAVFENNIYITPNDTSWFSDYCYFMEESDNKIIHLGALMAWLYMIRDPNYKLSVNKPKTGVAQEMASTKDDFILAIWHFLNDKKNECSTSMDQFTISTVVQHYFPASKMYEYYINWIYTNNPNAIVMSRGQFVQRFREQQYYIEGWENTKRNNQWGVNFYCGIQRVIDSIESVYGITFGFG